MKKSTIALIIVFVVASFMGVALTIGLSLPFDALHSIGESARR